MRSVGLKLLFLALVLVFVTPQGRTQDSTLRTVSGAAVDKNENGIASAVIYLRNVRTLTVRTYIADKDGKFRFSGLDPNADYEIHAEHDDLTSSNHTVSSFDNRKEITVTLKVDKEKKKSGN